MRFYGVLQRIAICYLIVGLFYLWDRCVWTKVAVLVLALIGYWILVQWVPVPGAGVPGRDIPFLDKNQNIVAWVDRQLMPGHLYEDSPLHNARDPEGLLSDIPALATTLIGLLAGLWLRESRGMTVNPMGMLASFWLRGERAVRVKALGLGVGALACLAMGYFWSQWFPLNKKMWTSSYVLVAAGWSLVAFTVIYWAIEYHGWCRKGWSRGLVWPWLVFGSNAIVAYMVSELLGSAIELFHFTSQGETTNLLIYADQHVFTHIPDPGWRAFAYSVSYTFVCFIPVWILYRNKIFLKL